MNDSLATILCAVRSNISIVLKASLVAFVFFQFLLPKFYLFAKWQIMTFNQESIVIGAPLKVNKEQRANQFWSFFDNKFLNMTEL